MKDLQNIESEKKLEILLNNLVKLELKGLSLKLLSQHFSGLPDRICLIPQAIIFFAEIKTTNKKPRKIQLFVHAKLRALGFDVYVIDCSQDIENIRKKYSDKVS